MLCLNSRRDPGKSASVRRTAPPMGPSAKKMACPGKHGPKATGCFRPHKDSVQQFARQNFQNSGSDIHRPGIGSHPTPRLRSATAAAAAARSTNRPHRTAPRRPNTAAAVVLRRPTSPAGLERCPDPLLLSLPYVGQPSSPPFPRAATTTTVSSHGRRRRCCSRRRRRSRRTHLRREGRGRPISLPFAEDLRRPAPPPPCWTQEETGALIQAYRQKWYALRRGNLRAPHWEEVADAVASRCRHLYAAAGSPKTAVQCRHKMEKLRKRYRSEKRRPHRTSWVHFREMDAMEMGTPSGGTGSGGGPTSAAKGAAPPPPFPENFSGEEDNDRDGSDEEEEDDDDDDDDGERNGGVMSILANGGKPIDDLRFQVPKVVRTKADHWGNPKSHNAGGSNGCFKGFPGVPERKAAPLAAAAVVRKRVEERRRKEREPAALEEVAAAEMKMEMAREMEKLRMDMELKRTELVLESQRWIVDAFVKGIWHGKKKRARVSPDSH
ncbi:unnamed protein product [Spirodela intermedia]|uniref:Myb/SANT-like DNA-binding domain-containing protein n=1 Tax=Spirodela intermedia TaxID=51605 RepID=A0A7I8JUF1_SPIIN|nr:unnamed protein product [Spirodela intermedia]CAA6673724.1 unnamed protein product [Spirodela intermedia]